MIFDKLNLVWLLNKIIMFNILLYIHLLIQLTSADDSYKTGNGLGLFSKLIVIPGTNLLITITGTNT